MSIMKWSKGVSVIAGKIWEFAKAHPALFLGLATAMVSIVTFAYNALKQGYSFGYHYYGYHVTYSFMEMSLTTGISADFVFCIILTCFLAIYTLMGQEAYWKKQFCGFWGKTIVGLLLVCALPALISILSDLNEVNLITVLIAYGIVVIVLSVVLALIVLTSCAFPTHDDILKRERIKRNRVKEKLEKKNRPKIIKKWWLMKNEKINKKIQTIEEEKEKKKVANDNEMLDKKAYFCKRACALSVSWVMMFAIVFCAVMGCGAVNAKLNVQYAVIENKLDFVSEITQTWDEDTSANALVVLYERSDGVVVAPCITSDEEIEIYSSYQCILPYDGLIFHYSTYQKHYVK